MTPSSTKKRPKPDRREISTSLEIPLVREGDTLRIEDLGLAPERAESPRLTPEEYEREYLREALDQCGWVIKGDQGAAARLGMAPSTLHYRMKKLGLHAPRGRNLGRQDEN